jgi:DNA repair protein RAD16
MMLQRLTRMRQMACHPDLVLRSKNNATQFVQDASEATVCRLCNDVAEDAIQSKCRHIFDRECIKQYLESTFETNVSSRFFLLFYILFPCYYIKRDCCF